jgi:hypothetical protein
MDRAVPAMAGCPRYRGFDALLVLGQYPHVDHGALCGAITLTQSAVDRADVDRDAALGVVQHSD